VHEEILVWFKGLVAVTIPLAAFATGLRTSGTLQAAWLWRHPALLDRSLLCLLLIVPLWAVLAMQVLQVSPLVKTGILAAVLAIGIGPPAALERTQKTETPIEYEIGLDISLMLLSVVFLPAAVALHGAIFHHDVRLDAVSVAKVVLAEVLIPLGLGVFVARWLPLGTAAIAQYSCVFLSVAPLLIGAIVLVFEGTALRLLGLRAWLVCAVIVLGGILAGHWLGGPERDTRGVLAAFSAMRFPALALLIGAATPYGTRMIPVVLMYIVTSVVMVTAYRAIQDLRQPSQ
jgi:BASS family bile acid:Na+ symporter